MSLKVLHAVESAVHRQLDIKFLLSYSLRMVQRLNFWAFCSQCGLASTLFPNVVWARSDQTVQITVEMISQAALIAGVTIPEELRAIMLEGLNENLMSIEPMGRS